MNTYNRLEEEIAVQDYVAELYNDKRYAVSYSLVYHRWWAKKLLSFLNLRSPILDNGCGTGFMSQFLKGYEVIGLDMSPEMIKLAKKRYSKVLLGDAQNMPFGNSSFQIVINRGVLHHLEDPEKGISEINRVLKKGGEAVFTEPIASFVNLIPRTFLRGTKHFSPLHKNFQEKELIRIISSHLEIEKIYYFGFLSHPLLGFPDVVNIYKFFPFKRLLTPFLIKFDETILKIPVLNKQICWCVMITARKQ